MQTAAYPTGPIIIGLTDRIRTCDLVRPRHALYQTELQSDFILHSMSNAVAVGTNGYTLGYFIPPRSLARLESNPDSSIIVSFTVNLVVKLTALRVLPKTHSTIFTFYFLLIFCESFKSFSHTIFYCFPDFTFVPVIPSVPTLKLFFFICICHGRLCIKIYIKVYCLLVATPGLEPGTSGVKVLRSTN